MCACVCVNYACYIEQGSFLKIGIFTKAVMYYRKAIICVYVQMHAYVCYGIVQSSIAIHCFMTITCQHKLINVIFAVCDA